MLGLNTVPAGVLLCGALLDGPKCYSLGTASLREHAASCSEWEPVGVFLLGLGYAPIEWLRGIFFQSAKWCYSIGLLSPRKHVCLAFFAPALQKLRDCRPSCVTGSIAIAAQNNSATYNSWQCLCLALFLPI